MSKYKDSVFLPKTSLPMKAKPEGELNILGKWDSLYTDIRSSRTKAMPWILHDGPPYANGDIHIGHALNKILKDIHVRGHNLLGYDAPFIPGWDCHGLPIEWKVEEEWRKSKKDKNADPVGFRADCRAFATKWVDTQKEQFKRLGVLADWDNWFGTYRTMQPEWESGILHTFHDMVRKGLVYRANKPVMWSPVEKTALADAETVDREHIVPNIWVCFPVHSGPLMVDGANLLVWTTTPWSLPGNVAVAYNPAISYGLYDCPTGRYVVADALVEQALPDEDYERIRDVTEADFVDSTGKGHTLFHPLGDGYKTSRIIPADFVRETSGTGFVHIGPAHSTEDWVAWRNIMGDKEFPNPIMENGVYASDMPVFAGVSVTKGKKLGPANEMIVDHLLANGMLYQRDDRPLTMQHSWRSDAVLITRAAPQVFIDLDEHRQIAIDELEPVGFTPDHAKQRMISTLRNRPDWLVSRQRLWGTPLALFVHKETGAICDDNNVLMTTHQTLMDAGSEEWFNLTVEDIFKYSDRSDGDQWERLDDVLDVWFDSGCVPVMMNNQANLVVEGVDQNRGWFSSTLMVSVLGGKSSPYKNVLMHGFALDQNGRKMSKSEGNVLDPQNVVDKYGADVLRVWVASTDVTEDLRVSMDSMVTHAETARKIRNTLRYMIGALHDYDMNVGSPDSPENDVPELERYIRHRMIATNDTLADMLRSQNMTKYMTTVVNFCNNDLSSLLFDIRKDSLYCDARSSLTRRAYRYLLNQLFHHLVVWIAPVMSFTAEELFQERYPSPAIVVDGETVKNRFNSVHMQHWPQIVDSYRDDALAAKWERIIGYRSIMLRAIEDARSMGVIKTSNEANLAIMVDEHAYDDLHDIDLAELAITGSASIVEGKGTIVVNVTKIETPRCDRCWLSKPDVREQSDGYLCQRCEEVMG